MLTIARQTMTLEKITNVFEAIYIKALTGDITAAKLLLHYTIGKPGDAPHPDHIERDEWDRHQKNAIRADEMKLALGSLPCSLGNEIVSTALPLMTAARANELAAQLRGEESGARDEKERDGGKRMRDETNGNESLESTVMSDGGTSKSAQDQTAAQDNPCDVDVAPPLTNRFVKGKTAHRDSRRRSAKNQSRVRCNQPPTTIPSSPATRHKPPATFSAPPLTNRKSNGSAGGKKERKLVAKQWLQPLAAKLNGGKHKAKKRSPARV